ncbi:hypothetical protein R1flu_000524 [Riccia fluitans]|uniref:Uncharacterized protein n=1 Tax=Riccia fluitans TaxID=41844 RepID=A0ABD1Y1M2_9MARC
MLSRLGSLKDGGPSEWWALRVADGDGRGRSGMKGRVERSRRKLHRRLGTEEVLSDSCGGRKDFLGMAVEELGEHPSGIRSRD